MTLRKPNCFSKLKIKKVISTKLLWPPALWLSGWEEYFPLWCTNRNCLQCPSLPPNPIKSCIVFISEICYFRMTEIFSQLRRGAEICKYVFGSVTVTMFSLCFFFRIWNCLLPLWEFKKKKKNLYVNLSKYSKENKLAIKFSFYIRCFKNVLAIWNVLEGKI